MKTNLFCLFLLILLANSLVAQKINVVPYPSSVLEGKGKFVINAQTRILHVANLKQEALQLAEVLKNTSFPIRVEELSAANSWENSIILSYDKKITDDEGYTIEIKAKNVIVKGNTAAGVFYGIQTLRQLLPVELESVEKAKTVKEWILAGMTIKDDPRFGWRGMHLDVSRHFFSVDYLKTFIDRMAIWKFNRLHLHLTDDQGWRLEIKKYPRLTSEGAWRTMNDQDKSCIERSKTNPDFTLPREFFKSINGTVMYGGFYTQEQMLDVIQYAKLKHIEIVPEIDIPGHFMAAINLYPYLSCAGSAGWGSLFSRPLCAGNDSVYALVEDILSEVTALFPFGYVHIGADEVEKSEWVKCPKCQAVIKRENLKNEHELQAYFVHRMEQFLIKKGKKMIGWDEIIDGGLTKEATVMYWRSWEKGVPEKTAKLGNDVILTPSSHCYFDYPQTNEFLKLMYSFDPVPLNLNPKLVKHILGVQANLWTEYIPTPQRLEYMAFPRMLSLSEAAWTSKKTKNWESFTKRMTRQYERLNGLNINYYIPEPTSSNGDMVFLDKTTLELSTSFANGIIRYTTDGSEPTANSEVYAAPLILKETTTVKSKVFSGNKSSLVKVNLVRKDKLHSALKISNLKKGLNCNYYEAELKTVNDIEKQTVVKADIAENFKLPLYHREEAFAVKYEGYIRIPVDGVYSFFTSSDDGSALYVDNEMVVNNDGAHGDEEKSGMIALKTGLHSIKVLYFEIGGGQSLKVSYQAKGMLKASIPNTWLMRKE